MNKFTNEQPGLEMFSVEIERKRVVLGDNGSMDPLPPKNGQETCGF